MPVPLSVTNPKAKGLAAQVAAELPTEGPFARLQVGQQGTAAADRAGAAGAAAQQQAAEQPQAAEPQAGDMAVETHHLSFSYPDIGARDRGQCRRPAEICAGLPYTAGLLLPGPS